MTIGLGVRLNVEMRAVAGLEWIFEGGDQRPGGDVGDLALRSRTASGLEACRRPATSRGRRSSWRCSARHNLRHSGVLA